MALGFTLSKHYLMQPQLPFIHQFLHKISHKQHPWYHQHEREDKRHGLQEPEEGRDAKCQSNSSET